MKIILSSILLSLGTHCFGQVKSSSNDYYFPFEKFLTEKTYCFINKNDTTEKALWKMKSSVVDGDSIFQTIIYNRGVMAERIIETVQKGSYKIRLYTLYHNDKSSDCNIIDSLVYKADQKIEEQIQWAVTFTDFESANIVGLTKTRKLESTSLNKQAFLDRMKVDVIGTSTQFEYSLYSIYENGKGLISYKITRPNGQIKHFDLAEVK